MTLPREDWPNDEGEGGRQFRARILRYGWMTPASGHDRSQHTLAEGLTALKHAKRHRGTAERVLGSTFTRAWRAAPLGDRLEVVASGGFIERREAARFEAWERSRVAIGQALRSTDRHGWQDRHWLLSQWRFVTAELEAAREKATEAFYWLDDFALDLGETVVHFDDGNKVMVLGPASGLAAAAHREVHLSGDLYSGLLLCRIVEEGGTWWQECPVNTLHLRCGVSPGFTTKFTCTVCHGDATECVHVAGADYDVVVGDPVDGTCAVCGEEVCGHPIGSTMTVTAASNLVFGAVHEVSLTPRPRDPLARIDRIEISGARLERLLTANPQSQPHHTGCMCFCSGMQPWEKGEVVGS